MHLLDLVQKQPLSLEDMKYMLGIHASECNVFINDELKGMNYKQLFEKPKVILLLGDGHSVGHWVGLIKRKNEIEYFDPYGFGIEKDIQLSQSEPYLLNICKGYKIHSNHHPLQKLKKDINTCGRWVIVRIRLSELSINEFEEIIKEPHQVSDITITLLTFFLQPDSTIHHEADTKT